MTTPLRVAVFTDNDFEKVNGVTTTLTAALRYAPADVSPRVYTASRLAADLPDYFAVASWGVGIPFYREMKMYWPRYRRLMCRLVRDHVEVVHLTTPGPIGLAAVAAARRLRLPLVGSFHTDLAAYTRVLSGRRALGALMQRYMQWLYGHCEAVLVPSAATHALLTRAGTPVDRVGVWSRGVDVETFSPARRSAELRRQWGAEADAPVLLYVGRVSEEKGVRQLPLLHEWLIRCGIRHRLVIVGDGPLRPFIASRCPGAICVGTLGRDALAEAYASADVFVFPSTTDTAGNVVLEAQASGLPVIVSQHGGPRELMAPDVSGLVCGDAFGDWLAAAARLLSERIDRGRFAAAARRFAMGRSWPAALAPLYDAYRQAAGRARTEPRALMPAHVA